ncbi:hypothetical protein C8R48DRAFT_773550 [Suillus tomentosus]|nr:hypothetical protein C8R48DRAFT_773550 [Suillus tomentosus]
MYSESYGGQPVDAAALDDNLNGQSTDLAIHSSYPQAAGYHDLNFQQHHHDSSYFMDAPGPSASFVDDAFQFTLDPHVVGYHPIYNPYQGSGPPHASPSQYFPLFPPLIVSIDGTSTLAPGTEDIRPLEEPLRTNEPLEPSPPPPCASASHNHQPPEKSFPIKFWPYPHSQPKLRGLAASVQRAASSKAPLRPSRLGPLQYDNKVQIHRKIFKDAGVILIRSALTSCPFLTEQERKTAAHEALLLAVNAYDDEYRERWSAENLTAFYKSFTVSPSADIMSTCKKISRAVVEIGYVLRPSVWSEDSEPQYGIDMVKDLIDNPSFPLKFIFGNSDSGGHQVDKLYPFEHRVITTVVINAILKLGYVPHITELDSLFCTASAAVECALQERASRQLDVSIDFGVSNFKSRYTVLFEYIRDHIKPNPELSARWEEFKNRIRARLIEITAYHV